jgi:hypothetical protein
LHVGGSYRFEVSFAPLDIALPISSYFASPTAFEGLYANFFVLIVFIHQITAKGLVHLALLVKLHVCS